MTTAETSIDDDSCCCIEEGETTNVDDEEINHDDKEDDRQLSRKIEGQGTRHVMVSMTVVFVMIAITATIMLTFTHSFLKEEEQDEFEHGFQQQANVIAEAAKFHAITMKASLEALSDSITSFTIFTGEHLNYSWPCITIPDFDRRGQRAQEEAFLEMVAFSPLVNHHKRHDWATYTAQNAEGWLGGNGTTTIGSEIYQEGDKHAIADTSDWTIPIWQTAPAPNDPSLVNFNVLSEALYSDIFHTLNKTQHMTISAVYDDSHVVRKFFDAKLHDEVHDHRDHHLGGDHSDANHQEHSKVHPDDGEEAHGEHGDGSAMVLDSAEHKEEHTDHDMHVDDEEMAGTIGSEHQEEGSPHTNHDMHVDEEEVMTGNDVGLAQTLSPSSMNPHDTSSASADSMHGHAHGHERRRLVVSHSDHSAPYEGSNSSETLWAMTRPHSVVMAPIYDSFDHDTRSLVGIVHGILAWEFYLTDLLPPGITGIIAILQNSCGQAYTFEIQGAHAEFIGEGDLHDQRYSHIYQDVPFGSLLVGEKTSGSESCVYSMRVYPSKTFEATFNSNQTETVLALLGIVFSVLAIFFLIFVWFVQRRQRKVMGVAKRTTAIISNLFPEAVRTKIMEQAEMQAKGEAEDGSEGEDNLRNILRDTKSSSVVGKSSSLLLGDSNEGGDIWVQKDAPIANLYKECTVFFADIVGFTKWSSSREPAHVFTLLETLYGEFDRIARRRRVFKVETIGDCYVAVTGLPTERKDHAVAMARFAWNCLSKSSSVFNGLSSQLGNDTTDLNLRIGLHSGPVTAGVLRGEKGRFQLFGDTVNTSARMESSSRPGSIHCSMATADLLKATGRASWLTERSDKINPKGKGEMTTYWIHVKGGGETASQTSNEFSLSTTSAHARMSVGNAAIDSAVDLVDC